MAWLADNSIDLDTTRVVESTKFFRWRLDISLAGTFRSRILHISRKSSQLCDVVCTVRRERKFRSLWPRRRSDLLLIHLSAGTPIGREAGNSATTL